MQDVTADLEFENSTKEFRNKATLVEAPLAQPLYVERHGKNNSIGGQMNERLEMTASNLMKEKLRQGRRTMELSTELQPVYTVSNSTGMQSRGTSRIKGRRVLNTISTQVIRGGGIFMKRTATDRAKGRANPIYRF
jgi:hypothetical protein